MCARLDLSSIAVLRSFQTAVSAPSLMPARSEIHDAMEMFCNALAILLTLLWRHPGAAH
jgi:hypothetical protein